MNCGMDLAQALLAYKNGQRGYEPMQFHLRHYVSTSDASSLSYIYDVSFLPCSSRSTTQFSSCDYDREKIDYDTNNPIIFAPLPRHKFENAGLLVKFSAGFNGLSNNPSSNAEALFRVSMFRVADDVAFEPVVTDENGTYLATADSGSYSTVYTTYEQQTILSGSRQHVNLNVGGFFLVPNDGKQYFIAPTISCSLGVRCETAFLNVELFHEKM